MDLRAISNDLTGRPFKSSLSREVKVAIKHGILRTTYRNRMFLKSPFDVVLYLRLLEQLRPKTVIEIGSKQGGSALWFADMMNAIGIEGRVISIDLRPPIGLVDPRISFLAGDAESLEKTLDAGTLAGLPRPWLVSEDSAHTFPACLAVLNFFDKYLADGEYIAIEDGVFSNGPNRAIAAFLAERGDDYAIDVELCDYFGYNVTNNPNGWLKRTHDAAARQTGKPQPPEQKQAPAEMQSMSPLMSPQTPLNRNASAADRGARPAKRPGSPGQKHSVRRIKRIAQLVGAQSYLEIGVAGGHTFNALDFPRKVAVDPRFRFNLAEYRRAGVAFFETPSDTFFEKMAGSEKFDVIFIDGLHVFQQAYRDFRNTVKHAHDRTVFLIDDVVPIDEFSALPNQGEALRRRREAGSDSPAWHGDTYKVIFAIHDFHPDYSFVTVNSGGNPQTIVWKAPRQNVIPALGNIEAIEQLSFAEFLQRKNVMNLLAEDEAFQLLRASIAPADGPSDQA